MSILVKGNTGSGGSSSSKGFPPGDVNIISINSGIKSCKIKFSDPVNSIYNNITLSTWYSTIIVRKEGSAPTSIKDGDIVLTNTTRNKYKDNYFVDSNVTANKTYYYRFYTMSTDKVYNDSTSMIRSCLIREFDPVLKNNTWAQISEAAESGVASSLWNIGDEINIKLPHIDKNGEADNTGIKNPPSAGAFSIHTDISAQTVTLQIWDFNHFDKSDGSGKAGICFGTKNLLSEIINPTMGSFMDWDGYGNCNLRRLCRLIYTNLSDDIKSAIKYVNLYTNAGYGADEESYGEKTIDSVFAPGSSELFGNYPTKQYNTEKNQKQFPIFTNNNSRIKKMDNGKGSKNVYWTRSGSYESLYGICSVNENGSWRSDNRNVSDYDSTFYDKGFCFCFNV